MTRARRLDAVLRVRRLQEERARADLLHAHREEHRAGELVRVRRTAYDGLPPAAGHAQAAPAFLTDRAVRRLSATSLADSLAQARVAGEQREGRQTAWSAAAMRAEAVARLEARQQEAQRLETLRLEQAAADELTAARWGRRPA